VALRVQPRAPCDAHDVAVAKQRRHRAAGRQREAVHLRGKAQARARARAWQSVCARVREATSV
jgi:hypothetical protein